MIDLHKSRLVLTSFIGVATALTRILGFFRDVLLAALFGASPAADAFFVALRLPNMIRRLMGEGGFASGYVPVIHRLKRDHDPQRLENFITDSFLWIIIGCLILMIIFEMIANPLITILAPGLPLTIRDYAVSYFRAFIPLIAGVMLTGYFSAILIQAQKFIGQALIPLITNIGLVAVLAVFLLQSTGDLYHQGLVLSWTASALTFIQVAFLGYFAIREMSPFSIRLPRRNRDTLAMMMLVAPGLLVQFVTQLGFILVTMTASLYPAMISHLTYADRLVQLPLGFISAGLATIALTDFAQHLAESTQTALHRAIDRSMILALALSLPAMIGLVLLADPIIAVLFERGAFTAADRQDTANALIGLSCGLPFAATARVQMQVYFVREKIRIPLIAAVIGLLTLLAILFLLPQAPDIFSFALALTTGSIVIMAIQYAGINKLCGWHPQKLFFIDVIKLICACGILVLFLFGVMAFLNRIDFYKLDFIVRASVLAAACCGGAALYGGLIYTSGLGRSLR